MGREATLIQALKLRMTSAVGLTDEHVASIHKIAGGRESVENRRKYARRTIGLEEPARDKDTRQALSEAEERSLKASEAAARRGVSPEEDRDALLAVIDCLVCWKAVLAAELEAAKFWPAVMPDDPGPEIDTEIARLAGLVRQLDTTAGLKAAADWRQHVRDGRKQSHYRFPKDLRPELPRWELHRRHTRDCATRGGEACNCLLVEDRPVKAGGRRTNGRSRAVIDTWVLNLENVDPVKLELRTRSKASTAYLRALAAEGREMESGILVERRHYQHVKRRSYGLGPALARAVLGEDDGRGGEFQLYVYDLGRRGFGTGRIPGDAWGRWSTQYNDGVVADESHTLSNELCFPAEAPTCDRVWLAWFVARNGQRLAYVGKSRKTPHRSTDEEAEWPEGEAAAVSSAYWASGGPSVKGWGPHIREATMPEVERFRAEDRPDHPALLAEQAQRWEFYTQRVIAGAWTRSAARGYGGYAFVTSYPPPQLSAGWKPLDWPARPPAKPQPFKLGTASPSSRFPAYLNALVAEAGELESIFTPPSGICISEEVLHGRKPDNTSHRDEACAQ